MTTGEQETAIFRERDFVKEYKQLTENQTQRMLINEAMKNLHPIISLKCGTCDGDMFTITGPVHLLARPNGASRPVCLSCMEKHPSGAVFHTIEIRVLVQKPQMASDDIRIEKDIEREVRREGKEDRVYDR